MLIAGCAAWGTMIGAMLYGAQERRRYNERVTEINAADRPPGSSEQNILSYYDREGSRSNTDAIVSAVVGTTLSVIGAALLGRGLSLGKRHTRLTSLRSRATWRPYF